jgi:hypothetical protein
MTRRLVSVFLTLHSECAITLELNGENKNSAKISPALLAREIFGFRATKAKICELSAKNWAVAGLRFT